MDPEYQVPEKLYQLARLIPERFAYGNFIDVISDITKRDLFIYTAARMRWVFQHYLIEDYLIDDIVNAFMWFARSLNEHDDVPFFYRRIAVLKPDAIDQCMCIHV